MGTRRLVLFTLTSYAIKLLVNATLFLAIAGYLQQNSINTTRKVLRFERCSGAGVNYADVKPRSAKKSYRTLRDFFNSYIYRRSKTVGTGHHLDQAGADAIDESGDGVETKLENRKPLHNLSLLKASLMMISNDNRKSPCCSQRIFTTKFIH
jgi:hypothetical protein